MPIIDYMDELDLHSDPFTSEQDELWPGLVQLGQLLVHELEFSQSLAYLSGCAGEGKTVLAQWACRQLGASHEALFLDAQKGEGALQIAHKLNDWLLLPPPTGGEPVEWFAGAAQVINGEGLGIVFIVIDNIDRIPAKQTIDWLLALDRLQVFQTGRLKVLLLGRVPACDVIPENLTCTTFTAALPKPDAAELTAWLNQRFLHAGADELVFDLKVGEHIWQVADGSFARALELARREIMENGAAINQVKPKARHSLPVVHIVAVAALIASLSVIYLYSSDDGPEESLVTSRLELPRSAQLEKPSNNTSQAEHSSSSTAFQAPDRVIDRELDLGAGHEFDESLEPKGIVADQALEEGGHSEAASPQSITSEPNVPVEEQFFSVRPEWIEYSDDELELLSWIASDFTYQVLGVSSLRSAKRYVEEQSNSDILRIYNTRRKGKAWFVVVAGRFATKPEAQAAKDTSLNSTQLAAGPWLRPLTDIQREISKD
ncbi:AAA family ATPase [Gilvimarinus sp. SDUM040013]|uniref:AAA family ATPase n=1 Tax=Gilvimarinus gilvus TaxID=3058038 RepID=A0ABU4RYK1_9GAMM|nr:AAA family ATPase [Gilvimarinus sp. SDUM040013]MDO3387383.1 AAA family ATPase [Gilvimarinus sp. SDUM040013]MDX6849860.1 AAA family ATPase [Gilvimarinus sp. SDUM040013]